MPWKRTGRIFDPRATSSRWWSVSHAMLTVPIILEDDVLRVYYSPRDKNSRSRTTFIDFDPNTLKPIYQHLEPVLDIGRPGSFDDCGAMGSCIVPHAGALYLFYIGWNVPYTVGWRTTTGLAISYDGGYTFQKMSGPVLGRSLHNPFLTGSCWVLLWEDSDEQTSWRMWHLSGLGWETADGKLEPLYDVRVANSLDLLEWTPTPGPCIPLHGDSGVSVPSVIYWKNKWRMWYSYRFGAGHRTDPAAAYRIGYAESDNGETWIRKDKSPYVLPHDGKGWESVMQCYPRVYEWDGKLHMLYNGNGFGKTGFGHAVWED